MFAEMIYNKMLKKEREIKVHLTFDVDEFASRYSYRVRIPNSWISDSIPTSLGSYNCLFGLHCFMNAG